LKDFLRLLRVALNRERHLWQLNFEFCSRCNLRCRHCALDHSRDEKFLSFSTFVNVLDSLERHDYSIQNLVLSHSGDMLRHPDIAPFLYHLSARRKTLSIDRVIMDSNMTLMDRKRAELIIKSGAIDTLVCSIDGHDRQTFEYLRPPAKFDTVKENMQSLIDANQKYGPIEVVINCGNVSSPPCAISDEFNSVLELADSVVFYSFHDWGGQVGIEGQNVPKRFCKFAFRNAVIMANGDVVKCCYDLNGRTSYGNITVGDLHTVLTSRRRKTDLLKMFFAKRGLIQGCAECTIGG
jgi:sulfatase maturation enzyme AslB (radical SAM superfamily)